MYKLFKSIFAVLILFVGTVFLLTFTVPPVVALDGLDIPGLDLGPTDLLPGTSPTQPSTTPPYIPPNQNTNQQGKDPQVTVVPTTPTIKNPIGIDSLADLLNRLSVFIIPVAVIGFVFCVLYAGYVRLFSAGDSAKEKQSMAIAKSAAIGFLIIFMAQVVLLLLANIFKINV